MTDYPVTVALGSLFAVIAISRFATLGLVGLERLILGVLLKVEQVLVAIFLAGAKWVRQGLLCALWALLCHAL